METVGQLLTHVSGQLSDQQKYREFSRWPRKVMMEYLNQGLKEIAAYRPDAFSREIVSTLQPGSRQTVDAAGTIQSVYSGGKELNKTDMGILRAFSAYSVCPPVPRLVHGKLEFALRSMSVDENSPGVFFVSPPVPAGVSVEVSVQIVGEPPEYALSDWNKPIGMQAKYVNNLIDYIMARAYKRDAESQVSESKSQRLFSLFYQSMGQKYKIDSAHNSGFYKGEIGSGDSRAIIR